jgi:amidase
MQKYDFESSGAFVQRLEIEPCQSGPLDGLTFAVKDMIDLAGAVTGCGNPTWARTHPPAVVNATCVDQLLCSGARCLGKTVTDELAYSLIGENYFYGTPVNPKAPDRVPGGSSSGSASAVACGLVDFALGTDTGGSVRVPASNCGLWGYRPTQGMISMAGVVPFAPSLDTVGVFAREAQTLAKVIQALTGLPQRERGLSTLVVLDDLFADSDQEVREVLLPAAEQLGYSIQHATLPEITGLPIDYAWILEIYALIQRTEIWSALGPWIEATQPEFGPVTHYNFWTLAKGADRSKIQECIERRELFAQRLNQFLGAGHRLCFPTTRSLAPKRGTIGLNPPERTTGTYYPRTLSFTAIAGLSRTPQVTLPLAEIKGVPIGLSLLAGHGQDLLLAQEICRIR